VRCIFPPHRKQHRLHRDSPNCFNSNDQILSSPWFCLPQQTLACRPEKGVVLVCRSSGLPPTTSDHPPLKTPRRQTIQRKIDLPEKKAVNGSAGHPPRLRSAGQIMDLTRTGDQHQMVIELIGCPFRRNGSGARCVERLGRLRPLFQRVIIISTFRPMSKSRSRVDCIEKGRLFESLWKCPLSKGTSTIFRERFECF
jgi:hypothetical protein